MEAFPWFPAGTPFFFLSRGPPPFPFPKKRREKALVDADGKPLTLAEINPAILEKVIPAAIERKKNGVPAPALARITRFPATSLPARSRRRADAPAGAPSRRFRRN